MKLKLAALLAAIAATPLVACSNNPEPAPATNATKPTTQSAVAAPATTDRVTQTSAQVKPASFDAIMRNQGFTADQIDAVDAYRQAACSTLADNPGLKTNWNAATVKTEIQDSYDITLGNDAVAAILKSCN